MQTFSKKFLAILLTLCMLASFAPLSVFAAEASAEVVGQQLMLGDDLAMHFYTKVENASNATATISVGGAQRAAYTLSEMTAGENGYDLSVHMAAAEMTEEISLVVSDGESQLVQKTSSVKAYAQYLLDNNYTPATKALAKELLNYGAKAQLYFGNRTNDLANAGNEMETSAVIPAELPDVEITDSISGLDFYGASVLFQSQIAVRLYFTGSVTGAAFQVNEKAYTPVAKDNLYYIEVTGINPNQMDTQLEVSVTAEAGSLSFGYSPMLYISRMYNKESSSQALKDMLLAANGYFQAAEDFAGVEEELPPESLSFTYRYGTDNLIQVNTNLPSYTPCVNFTADQNGCSIDQSGNTVQWVGWIGMDNVDGTIVLAFHFNNAFEAGQSYVLPAGAIFGFTDNSQYPLDADYTFTWDGSSWTMTAVVPEPEPEPTEPEEGSIVFDYRYGTENLIQVNTNLPATTPVANFLTTDNGCSIDQSGNKYQQIGWIQMHNPSETGGVMVLTFHFNNAFEAGQSYVLPAGAIFGFTDGNTYTLNADYTFTWDGSNWTMTAVTPEPDEPEDEQWGFQYRYGTNNLIQVNTLLPDTTPQKDFLVSDNGCQITEGGDQQAGWIGMDNADGIIVLAFHFNAAFEIGQTYYLPAGSVFGFTDGNTYTLTVDHTFTWDGTNWALSYEAPEQKPEVENISLAYRYGAAKLIQFNTDLPATTPLQDFLADANGCQITQSGDQQVGYISMVNADGTIVLTFNFNAEFTKGQSYTLAAGSVFGFTDGSSYVLDQDYTLYWDGANWSENEPAKNMSLGYRYGAAKLIQFNTDLPATTPLKDFLVTDNGCQITQSGDQQVGYISMINADGTIVLTFNFNGEFTYGQSYTLAAGSVFGFTDGSSYVLDQDYILYWNGSAWSEEEPEKTVSLSYRYGAANLIQFNTNLPATTPLKDFLAADNGCQINQGGNQQVGYISMANADGTIVLTFNFNNAFTAGQGYTLAAGSVFGFTDGSQYQLEEDVTLYWDGNAWDSVTPIVLSYRYGAANLIQCNTNLPATTPLKDFLAADNGCQLIQSGDQQVGYISMINADGTIVLTFNFNAAFEVGQSYTLSAGSIFGFTDGSVYKLYYDCPLYWDGANWMIKQPAAQDVLDAQNF